MTRDSEPLRPCDAVFRPAPITEPTAAAASVDPASGQNFHLHQKLFFPSSSLGPFLALTGAGTRRTSTPTFLVRGCQMMKTPGTWHHRGRIPYSVISRVSRRKTGIKTTLAPATGGSCASGSLVRVRLEKMRAGSDLKRKSL